VASFHFPQLLYFSVFTTGLTIPYNISGNVISRAFIAMKKAATKKWTFLFLASICTIVLVLLIYNFTYEHIYLLADNRHYTFYLWKNIFRKNLAIRYFLIPVYVYSLFSIITLIEIGGHTVLFQLVYMLTVLIAVIPQQLLEFRYFIIPFLFFRLHIATLPTQKELWKWALLIEAFLYIILNVFTLVMFLFFPFQWEDRTLQRFMW